MKLKYLLAASVVSLSAAATIATPAAAQQITSGIEGQVTDADGNALPGALVSVTDERTGAVRTSTAGSNGGFRIQSLQPGGPYTVTVTADGYEGQTVENVSLNISGNSAFTFALTSGAGETIVVTGARARATQVAVGPGTAFDTVALESFPSITRDVRDIIRIDPRVSLEFGGEFDRISCLGGNDRANTFTVDGIIQADVFGLNGQPFGARNNTPLPFDVIEQTSVEFAPFDVEYSEFTGCLINVVTRGGSNKFSGSAFITYFDGGMQADRVLQADGDLDPFDASEEKRWGATLSGPIIKDRLFFSFGYEETELQGGVNESPFGAGVGQESNSVTLEEFNRFVQIANDVYGQDPGPIAGTIPSTSVRYFGRLDGQINDDHRVVLTYQRLEESNVEPDALDFSGLNSFELTGTDSNFYSAQFYSQWTDSISTELRVSRAEVNDVQGPFGFDEATGDNPVPRLVVGTPNLNSGLIPDGANGQLLSGPGFSRTANELSTKIDQARFIMNIDAGSGHNFKLGAELNDLEVFNLFVQDATGTLIFANLDDFEAGLIAGGNQTSTNSNNIVGNRTVGATIRGARDFDITNAAASFSRQIYSFFAQDDWQATDQLSINAGLRVQLYDGDAPLFNPLFADRFGFSNSTGFSRIDPVLLPRISATYEFDNDGFFSNSRVTGGVGVFSGGDPVVFFSNAFSNDGFAFGLGDTNTPQCAGLQRGPDGKISVLDANGNFTGVPQCVVNAAEAAASAGNGQVQTIAPDFDIPTAVRANIGFASEFGTDSGFFSNWRLNVDYIYTRFNDTLAVVDLLQQVNPAQGLNGFTVDGRPIYNPIDPLNPGCNAQIVGTGGNNPQWTGLSPACFNPTNSRVQEFLQLTNGPSFDAHNFSVIMTKRFSEGVFTQGGSVNVNFGYAFSDTEQTINSRSTTAGSQFDGTAAFDPQNLAVSQSGFETRHNFTLSVNFREEFIDDYDTSLGIFFRAAEGRPYSLVYNDRAPFFRGQSSAEENILAYIPTGANDPNLSPNSDPAAVASFLAALNSNEGLISDLNCEFTPGETIERNSCRNDWFFDLDLRISQELPFIAKVAGITNDRIELFADVVNVLNFIDPNWNSQRALGGFDGRVALVDGSFDDQGRYVLSNFTAAQSNANTFEPATAWRIQVGARYEF
ncbi:MAG: carboxypeptidase regulatory-like domain-containing protein [Parvularcula sp.]|jgi:hypothetical protein|nr:carboxypeptidase regulatory-like domain-containing protein [Parvularcula sp.]